MIPLRDNTRSRTFPVVNIILIILNALIFIRQLGLTPPQVNLIFFQYGLIPARVQAQLSAGASLTTIAIPFITAIFLHANWLHIIGNMLYLWIFGDNVEDRVGHIPYLFFYLLVGVAGNIAHLLANPASQVPIIGASGAIAGVLGAYFLTYPRAKVLTLVPIFFFITIIEIPAVIFLLFWFVMQVIYGASSTGISASPVAWWAHVGGFITGAILVKVFSAGRITNNRPY
jgi:membrane associated rhomboid family serine protease